MANVDEPDFLDEMIAESEATSPGITSRVAEALSKRRQLEWTGGDGHACKHTQGLTDTQHCRGCGVPSAQIDQAEESLRTATELLRQLEWTGDDGLGCGICDEYQDDGHAENCALARFLKG